MTHELQLSHATAPKIINIIMTIRNPTCVSSPGYAMVDSTIPRTTAAVVTAIVVSRTNCFAHYIVAEMETGKRQTMEVVLS